MLSILGANFSLHLTVSTFIKPLNVNKDSVTYFAILSNT